ncbi:MAG TPA: gamma-glutamylcyclotransferase family protein [Candidatus Saccharimonadia bacterium]|nr:gamma-glutamylcyclotransferase family protein [Candidatus Saccharimonadia bacterium]
MMKIITYGSLMNQASLEVTLGRPAMLTKIVIQGYRRVFNAPFDGYAFLNLASDLSAFLEAAWFEIEEAELSKFAVREAGSQLVKVRPGFMAFIWPQSATQNLPVLQSYINFCEQGAQALDIDMKRGLIKPRRIRNDTAQPLYP